MYLDCENLIWAFQKVCNFDIILIKIQIILLEYHNIDDLIEKLVTYLTDQG